MTSAIIAYAPLFAVLAVWLVVILDGAEELIARASGRETRGFAKPMALLVILKVIHVVRFR